MAPDEPAPFASALLAAFSLALLPVHQVLAHDAPLLQIDARESPGHIETLTAIIHALVIDDTALGTSTRHVELRLDDGNLVPLQDVPASALVANARVRVFGTAQRQASRRHRGGNDRTAGQCACEGNGGGRRHIRRAPR